MVDRANQHSNAEHCRFTMGATDDKRPSAKRWKPTNSPKQIPSTNNDMRASLSYSRKRHKHSDAWLDQSSSSDRKRARIFNSNTSQQRYFVCLKRQAQYAFCPEKTRDDLFDSFNANLHRFNAEQLALGLSYLVKVNKSCHLIFLQKYTPISAKHLGENIQYFFESNTIKPYHIALMLNSSAQLGLSQSKLQLHESIVSAAIKKALSNTKEIHDVANTLNGAAQLGLRQQELQLNEDIVSKAIKKALSDNSIKPIHVANILNGAAQLGLRQEQLRLTASVVSNAIHNTISYANAQSIANILNGAARLGLRQKQLRLKASAISNAIHNTIPYANAQSITNVLNGAAQLGLCQKELQLNKDIVSKAIKKALSGNSIKPIHVANILNGAAQLGLRQEQLRLKASTVSNAIHNTIPYAKVQEIANMLNGAALLDFGKNTLLIHVETFTNAMNIVLSNSGVNQEAIAYTFNAIQKLVSLDKQIQLPMAISCIQQLIVIAGKTEIDYRVLNAMLSSVQGLGPELKNDLETIMRTWMNSSNTQSLNRIFFYGVFFGLFNKNIEPNLLERIFSLIENLSEQDQCWLKKKIMVRAVGELVYNNDLLTIENKLFMLNLVLSKVDSEAWKSIAMAIPPTQYQTLNQLQNQNRDRAPMIDKVLGALGANRINWYLKPEKVPLSDIDLSELSVNLHVNALQRLAVLQHEIQQEKNETAKSSLVESIRKIQGNLIPISTSRAVGQITCTDVGKSMLYTFGQTNKCDSHKDDLVVMFPTRGQTPDLSVTMIIKALVDSLPNTSAKVVRVVIGVNAKQSERAELRLIIDSIQSELSQLDLNIESHTIYINLFCFTWQVEQDNTMTPFGELRNFLFDKVRKCIKHTEGFSFPYFLSMDGDITLTSGAISRALALEANEFTTAGHQVSQPDHDLETAEAFEIHARVQAHLYGNVKDKQGQLRCVSYGYPAESCLMLGPTIFEELCKFRQEKGKRIYGATDCEGRYLARYAQTLGGYYAPVSDSPGVILHNSKRFTIKSKAINDLKGILSWLSSLASQSQNLTGLDFFTRQLAYALSIPFEVVGTVTKHLYVPNLLKKGVSLQQLYQLTAEIDRAANQTDKSADRKDQAHLDETVKVVLTAYTDIVDTYGQRYADSILDNALRWNQMVVEFAIEKCKKLEHEEWAQLTIESAVVGMRDQGASVVSADNINPCETGDGIAKEPYTRGNITGRLPYAPLPSLTVAVTEEGEGVSGQGNIILNQKSTEQKLSEPSAEERAYAKVHTILKGLEGMDKELYDLIGPEHFGETCVWTAAEKCEYILKYLTDPNDGLGLQEDLIDAAFIREIMSGLMHTANALSAY